MSGGLTRREVPGLALASLLVAAVSVIGRGQGKSKHVQLELETPLIRAEKKLGLTLASVELRPVRKVSEPPAVAGG